MREVIVIGGGPAGSTSAILLAKAGRDVLLIERETGAHHKVCGEFIGPGARDCLHRLGLDLPSLGAQTIQRLRLSYRKRDINIQLPFNAYGFSRWRLDEALLQKAVESGAIIQRGLAATNLTQAPGRWHVATPQQVFTAQTVLLASGKHDVRHWPRVPHDRDTMVGFKMHFRLQQVQTKMLQHHIDMTFFEDGYAGLTLIEEDIANLCLVIPKKSYHACGSNWSGILEKLKFSSAVFAELLKGAIPCWEKPLAISGLPYGYMQHASQAQSLYKLGDQFATIGSLAGEGMAIALRSSFVAADAYINGFHAESYHHTMVRELRAPLRTANTLFQFTLNGAVPLLFHAPSFCSHKILKLITERLRINPI